MIIPANESVIYECRFSPNFKEQLYHKILTAQIIWSADLTQDEEITVPLAISLRLIGIIFTGKLKKSSKTLLPFLGHSFPENTSWIPRVEVIPPSVVLPSCLPSFPSTTTFLIQSKGHLPVLFKFLAPRRRCEKTECKTPIFG